MIDVEEIYSRHSCLTIIIVMIEKIYDLTKLILDYYWIFIILIININLLYFIVTFRYHSV